ncbi:hypothetical protein LguiA_026424 [Lonicera macranthoides]
MAGLTDKKLSHSLAHPSFVKCLEINKIKKVKFSLFPTHQTTFCPLSLPLLFFSLSLHFFLLFVFFFFQILLLSNS